MSKVGKLNKKESKNITAVDSNTIFYLGKQFYETAQKMRYEKMQCGEKEGNFIDSYIVNLLFSTELFFKSIIVANNEQKQTYGHNFYKLYQQLNDDIKEKICNECPVIKDIDGTDISFEDSLEDIGDAFEYWRYIYEKSWIHISLSFIEALSKSVMDIAETVKKE